MGVNTEETKRVKRYQPTGDSGTIDTNNNVWVGFEAGGSERVRCGMNLQQRGVGSNSNLVYSHGCRVRSGGGMWNRRRHTA